MRFPAFTACIVSIELAIAVGAYAQQPQAQTPEPQHQPYIPDLSDIMETTQLRHFKLGYAGVVKNWSLANYELQQITKSFDNAARYYPKFDDVNQSKLISDISTPALKEVGDAIKARDSDVFSRAFAKLTTACNSCHRVAHVGFIVIRVPTSSPFTNQLFTPERQ